MTPDLTLTAPARRFIARMLRFSAAPAGGFRLQVSAGGCSGYDLRFDVLAQPQPGDADLDLEGLRLFLPAESRLLLDGGTLDFAETPTGGGLTLSRPGDAACGCSTADARPAVAAVSLASLVRR